MLLIDWNGEPVAIANVDGTHYAFQDTCTHRGCSLVEGDLDGVVVTCACHGSQYDIRSGEVVGGPPPEPVKTYGLNLEGDDLVMG
jgi:nitrite reductase/ring-hydroxylating ferredoxin subunit